MESVEIIEQCEQNVEENESDDDPIRNDYQGDQMRQMADKSARASLLSNDLSSVRKTREHAKRGEANTEI